MNAADALAKHRLARARIALEEAAVLVEHRHFSGAMNRMSLRDQVHAFVRSCEAAVLTER